MRPPLRATSALRRLVAAGCAALVVVLTLAAVSPGAHAWIHATDTHAHCPADHESEPPLPTEHGCAVVLFASGIDVPLALVALPPVRVATAAVVRPRAAELFLSAPRFLLQPERGPPQG